MNYFSGLLMAAAGIQEELGPQEKNNGKVGVYLSGGLYLHLSNE